jgi:hypothetical protein
MLGIGKKLGTDDSMRTGEWEFSGAENQSAGLV